MKSNTKRGCLWSAGVLAVMFFIVAAVLYYMIAVLEWPGGMGASYPAKDYDARLTKVAATALPMIKVIEQYRHDHGGEFPRHAADFSAYVAPSSSVIFNGPVISMNGWIYTRPEHRPGYGLLHKLGWDPALIYEFDGVKGSWTFNPGDGRPEKVILLKP